MCEAFSRSASLSKKLPVNRRLLRGAVLFGCAATLLQSHDPITTKLTWTQEISRIVYKRCAGCHKPGGAAMPLTSYAEARPWAKAIRNQVALRKMPPWGAVDGIGDFAGDPSLSQAEIEMLMAWVEGGAPEGDPNYLPHRVEAGPVTIPAVPASRPLKVVEGTTLKAAVTLVAIRPSGPADVWAVLPDGAVSRLIWLREYVGRNYVLRAPERLPAGARLRVSGAPTVFWVRPT
jgi:hypothetical protein